MPELPGWLLVDDAETPDTLDPGVGHRSRRTALLGLAVVTAIVVVTVALVAVFVDTSARPPTSPRAAAQVWVNTIVHRNDAHRTRFECPTGSPSLPTVRAVARLSHRISAQPAQPDGAARWRVPLAVDDGTGQRVATLDVQVVRRAGAFEVC